MSGTAAIREAIGAACDRALGPDVTHRYQRYAKRRHDFVQLYMRGDLLFGGFVTRTGLRQEIEDSETDRLITSWRIDVMRGLEDGDESELLFDAQVDALLAAFRGDETLGGTVATIRADGLAGPQLSQLAPAEFGGVLVHHARIELRTVHFTARGDAGDLNDFRTAGVDWDLPGGEAADAEDDVTLPQAGDS